MLQKDSPLNRNKLIIGLCIWYFITNLNPVFMMIEIRTLSNHLSGTHDFKEKKINISHTMPLRHYLFSLRYKNRCTIWKNNFTLYSIFHLLNYNNLCLYLCIFLINEHQLGYFSYFKTIFVSTLTKTLPMSETIVITNTSPIRSEMKIIPFLSINNTIKITKLNTRINTQGYSGRKKTLLEISLDFGPDRLTHASASERYFGLIWQVCFYSIILA